jgi:hypothetical protein
MNIVNIQKKNDAYQKLYYQVNETSFAVKSKMYYESNKEEISKRRKEDEQYNKNYVNNTPEKHRIILIKNRDKILQ